MLTHVEDSQSDEILNLWRRLEGLAMGSAIGLWDDFDAAGLSRLARTTKSANRGHRLLALAEIYDGGSRNDAARIGGAGLQIVRDWVVRFDARGSRRLENQDHAPLGQVRHPAFRAQGSGDQIGPHL
jgi:hypothetical protein